MAKKAPPGAVRIPHRSRRRRREAARPPVGAPPHAPPATISTQRSASSPRPPGSGRAAISKRSWPPPPLRASATRATRLPARLWRSNSVATWIEQADSRIEAVTLSAAGNRQDRLSAALSNALGAFRHRVDGGDQDTASRDTPESPAPRGADPALPENPPLTEAFASLRDEMARLINRVEERRNTDWTAIVDGIHADMDGLKGTIGETRVEVASLERLMRGVATELSQGGGAQIEALSSSLAELDRRILRMAEDLVEGPPRIRSEIDRLAGTIELLAANGVDRASVTRLEAELHGIRQAVAETSEPQRIERLSEAVAVLGRQMAEMRLSQVGRPDFTDLKSDLDDIRAELKQAGAAREHSDVPGALHGLGQQIAGLAERVSVRQAGPEETERLARVVDRLSEEISAIAEHLRAAPKDVHESLERIEDGLRQIGAETETVNIELMLRAVQERLDRAPMTATALQGLEAQIAALTAKLDSSGTADPLQSVIDETLTQVRTLRDEADHIAERAARAALREVLHHLPQAGPQADFDALKQGFTELKALHTVADKKTQQTLKAVHNALETLLNRLPPAMPAGMQPPAAPEAPEAAPTAEPSSDAAPAVRLEAAVRKLHAAAISQVEEVTAASIEASSGRPVQDSAPEEVLLEPGTPRAGAAAGSGASFTTLKDAEPADVRASFIAAARRAARAAQAEKEGPQTPEGAEGSAEPPISNQTLIDRIRQTFESHRRPLLLGLALLVVAAGAVQIMSRTKVMPLRPVSPPVASEHRPAPANLPKAPPTELGRASQLDHDTPVATGSLLQPPASLPAPLIEVVRIPDMAGFGELPAALPASLRSAAAAGDAAAVYEVASRAAEGRGLPPDPALAARLFEKAAAAGLVPAQYRLGSLYEKGLGVGRDPAKAKAWYEKAAERGNAKAMHNLGVLFAEGVDGKPDYGAAQRWFLAAAEFGVKDSQYNLAVLLARGLGVPIDLSQSYKWFAVAAGQGDQEAMKKRDEVAARLGATDLAAARALAEAWRARPANPTANEVPPSPQDWGSLRSPKQRS